MAGRDRGGGGGEQKPKNVYPPISKPSSLGKSFNFMWEGGAGLGHPLMEAGGGVAKRRGGFLAGSERPEAG